MADIITQRIVITLRGVVTRPGFLAVTSAQRAVTDPAGSGIIQPLVV
jgi:hypothetical protein